MSEIQGISTYGSPEYNILMKRINANNIKREFNPLYDALQIYKNGLHHKDLTIRTDDLRVAFGDAFHDLYVDSKYHTLINGGNQRIASVYALSVLDSKVKEISSDKLKDLEIINSEMLFLMDKAGQFMNK